MIGHRRFKRIELNKPCYFVFDGIMYSSTVTDLSVSGCSLVLNGDVGLPEGSSIMVLLDTNDLGGEGVCLFTEVVWSSGCLVGCRIKKNEPSI